MVSLHRCHMYGGTLIPFPPPAREIRSGALHLAPINQLSNPISTHIYHGLTLALCWFPNSILRSCSMDRSPAELVAPMRPVKLEFDLHSSPSRLICEPIHCPISGSRSAFRAMEPISDTASRYSRRAISSHPTGRAQIQGVTFEEEYAQCQ